MTRLLPDRFVQMLLTVLVLAWFFPLSGEALATARNVIFAGVFLLFFFHGLRLPRGEVVRAAKAWRLQGAMLGFCYLAMPLLGWGLTKMADSAMPAALLAGVIYLSILPSTVQSAVSYASIARGNVAASVVAAALSNLSGIFITPALVAFLIGAAGGGGLGSDVVVKIATMLLLPFILGQIAQKWMSNWAAEQKKLIGFFDRTVILLAVFIAFAGAVGSGALEQLSGEVLIALILMIAIMLIFGFGGAMLLGGVLRFDRADRISLLFTGAHKSVAMGAPMAAIIFGSEAGLVILPAIIYHMAQLILSAPLANYLARKADH